MVTAQLRADQSWRRPACDDRCRVVYAFLPGLSGRERLEIHDPDAHEGYMALQASGGVVLHTGNLVVDMRTRSVVVDGHDVWPAGRELQFLTLLARSPDVWISTATICADALNLPCYSPSEIHMIRILVSRLRHRLGTASALIETWSGVGYRLRMDEPIQSERVLVPAPASSYKLPPGKWARDYDGCIACGRTNIKHHARGRCCSCDRRRYKTLTEAR